MRLSLLFVRRLVALGACLGLLVLVSPTAAAQGDGEVIAEGFNGPLGVLVDPAGDIWVIDSGLGGDTDVEVLDPETGEMVQAKLGDTARIVKVDGTDGSMSDVAPLPSVATADGAAGGSRLALVDGQLYATVGEWGGDPASQPPAGLGTVMAVGADGSTTEVAALWPYEVDNNPYPPVFETHPFGLTASPEGQLWVTDAAGNTLLAVDPASGAIDTVAVFDPIPGVFPRPDLGGELLTDPVPTAVTLGSDGGIYVSLLSGAPFVPGSAKVLSVGADGSVSDFATGLTMLTDLRTGPDGNMYATQFAVFGEEGPDPFSGAVVRIAAGEGSEVVIPGLNFASSLDFDSAGNAYVAVNGVGAPGSGQIMKFAGVAAPADAGLETETTDTLPRTGADPFLMTVIGATIAVAGVLVLRSRLADAGS